MKTLKEINESIPVTPPSFKLPSGKLATKREAWEWLRELKKNMTSKQKACIVSKSELN